MRSREHVGPEPEGQPELNDSGLQEAERSHVEELTAAFQESWEKNHEEGDPEVSFKILFSAHEQAQDVHSSLRSELENADIYMPELSGWTAEDVELWNEISSGKTDPDSLSYPTAYLENLFNALHESGVVVLPPGLPKNHPLIEQGRSIIARRGGERFLPFNKAVEKYDGRMHDRAMVVRSREEEIMKNIPPLIRKAREDNEALQKKESLNVVLTYGSVHTSLYHALSRTGSDTKREINIGRDYVFSHSLELLRNHLFGVAESEHNKDLAARALVADAFYPALERELGKLKARTDEVLHVSRMAVETLTIEDLREVWKVHLKMRDPVVVLTAIEDKGFTIPTTREELDEMLQSKRKP